MKTGQSKNYWTQQKKFKEGSLQHSNPTSKKKKKQEKSEINSLILQLKQLKKEEQTKPKAQNQQKERNLKDKMRNK